MKVHGKSAPIAAGRDSCPVASYVLSILDNETNEKNRDSSEMCEKALCDQINRKITFKECADILEQCDHALTPAILVKNILDAYDNHRPGKNDADSGNYNKRCRMWSAQEDVLLLAAIHKYGLGDWKSISIFVGGGRSRSQCSQRWGRALDPRITKVAWDPKEEEDLCSLVKELGEHKWATVAKRLGTRSDVQCRYRFYQIMKRREIIQKQPTIMRQAYSLTGPISSPSSSPQTVEKNYINSIPYNNTQNIVQKQPLVIFPTINHQVNMYQSPQDLVKSLFKKDLFNCPLEQMIPPLIPRSKAHDSEPGSPIQPSIYPSLPFVC